MGLYKVETTEFFELDLAKHLKYVSFVLDAPIAAKNILSEIRQIGETLSTMPYRYPLFEDDYLNERKYRKCVIKSMIIFYQVIEEEKIVCLHRILHSNQDWITMLLE